jgi:hypothetical protein
MGEGYFGTLSMLIKAENESVVGSWASGAPLLSIRDFYQFDHQVYKSLKASGMQCP